MARYRKIDTRIWNDQKFNELSNDGKLVFFLLLTHPHLTSVGAMRASLPGLASELRWPFEKFKQAFNESHLKKMVYHDESSSFIWLPNFLTYNHPESPNVVRSWQQSLDYLPECLLKNALIFYIKSYLKKLSPSFQEAFPKAFGMTTPNQEQEQEQEQKQEKLALSGKPDVVLLNNSFSKHKSMAGKIKSDATKVLNFLNEKTGRAYRPVDTNLKLIIGRLNSGATVQECFQVIAKKTREWKNDEKMSEYLRPATLFNVTKFEQYVGELVAPNHEGCKQ